MNKSDECVKVVVRVRPLSNDEERNGNKMQEICKYFKIERNDTITNTYNYNKKLI